MQNTVLCLSWTEAAHDHPRPCRLTWVCLGIIAFGCCVQGTLGSARVLRKATRGSQNTTGNLRQTLGWWGWKGTSGWPWWGQSGARTQGPQLSLLHPLCLSWEETGHSVYPKNSNGSLSGPTLWGHVSGCCGLLGGGEFLSHGQETKRGHSP